MQKRRHLRVGIVGLAGGFRELAQPVALDPLEVSAWFCFKELLVIVISSILYFC